MSFEMGKTVTPEVNSEKHTKGDIAIEPPKTITPDIAATKELQTVLAAQVEADNKVDKILCALKGGLEGAALTLALSANPAEAAPPDAPTARVEAPQQETQKTPLIRGVASDPTLGTFTVEAAILGAKKDGTFGFDYMVTVNNEKLAVQSSRRLRNGATFLVLEKGMQVAIPAGYGEGSDKPARLILTDSSGKPVELNIERRQ